MSELKGQLSEYILDHQRRHPGAALTNFGGWHSATGRLEFCAGAGQTLIQHMGETVERRRFASMPVRVLSPAAELDPERLGKNQPKGRLQPDAHASRCDMVKGLLRRSRRERPECRRNGVKPRLEIGTDDLSLPTDQGSTPIVAFISSGRVFHSTMRSHEARRTAIQITGPNSG